jgi:hypothetical protein
MLGGFGQRRPAASRPWLRPSCDDKGDGGVRLASPKEQAGADVTRAEAARVVIFHLSDELRLC